MARKNTKAKRQVEVPISYLIELTGWHWEYDFGLTMTMIPIASIDICSFKAG